MGKHLEISFLVFYGRWEYLNKSPFHLRCLLCNKSTMSVQLVKWFSLLPRIGDLEIISIDIFFNLMLFVVVGLFCVHSQTNFFFHKFLGLKNIRKDGKTSHHAQGGRFLRALASSHVSRHSTVAHPLLGRWWHSSITMLFPIFWPNSEWPLC